MASPMQPVVSQVSRRARAAKHWRIVFFSWMLAGVCAVSVRQFQFAMYSQSAGSSLAPARGATTVMRARKVVDDTDSRFIKVEKEVQQLRKTNYATVLTGLIMGSVAAASLAIPFFVMKGDLTIDKLQTFMGQTESVNQREVSSNRGAAAVVRLSSSQVQAKEESLTAAVVAADGENWDWQYVEDDVVNVVPPPPDMDEVPPPPEDEPTGRPVPLNALTAGL